MFILHPRPAIRYLDFTGIMISNIQNKWLRQIAKLLFIALLATATTFLYCNSCLQSWEVALYAISYSIAIWVTQWRGNEIIIDYLDTKVAWVHNPRKRFLLGLTGVLIYTPVSLTLLHLFYYYVVGINSGFNTVRGFFTTNFVAMGITIIIASFFTGYRFLQAWRQEAVNVEKLKRQSLASQYESLKNQVNPHFLFNSLNALTSLVHKDPDKAVRFIKQLSDVYRYVLENKDKEVVALTEELKFIKSYLYLQQIRFGENLQAEMAIEDDGQMMLPPLSLQLLVENAIKHNIISKDEPLIIKLFTEGEQYVVVSNNLQVKSIPKGPSGIGLENIKARYGYLTDNEVQITKTKTAFTVKLPVLTME